MHIALLFNLFWMLIEEENRIGPLIQQTKTSYRTIKDYRVKIQLHHSETRHNPTELQRLAVSPFVMHVMWSTHTLLGAEPEKSGLEQEMREEDTRTCLRSRLLKVQSLATAAFPRHSEMPACTVAFIFKMSEALPSHALKLPDTIPLLKNAASFPV
ncbi:hypothetical protein XENOCAPTIV_030230 [Xenoophorus captivus]|uniref:Uncharacterized protein n=1 Tax=Xenoophorus captivus TaxID=1517983 RepID=A0ABV0QXB4_9TELE